jgi:hypothetical protein
MAIPHLGDRLLTSWPWLPVRCPTAISPAAAGQVNRNMFVIHS